MLEESKELLQSQYYLNIGEYTKVLMVVVKHRYEDPRALHRQQYFETMETVKGEITRQFQQQGMLLTALVKTLLCAFDCEYSIPDEISLYS